VLKKAIIGDRAVTSRRFAALAVIFLAMEICGCAASPGPGASATQSGPAAARPIFDASGVWDGQSVASCTAFNPLSFNTRCNAINKVTITMVQENAKITGFYKCSIGNMDCRNQNDSGTIATGSMQNGRLALRIGMPDGSSCLFNGVPTGANQIKGSYSCYQGGGLAEQGRFEVGRNY
jgi:hypothetical protein